MDYIIIVFLEFQGKYRKERTNQFMNHKNRQP